MPLKLTLSMPMLLLVAGFPYQRVLEEEGTTSAGRASEHDSDDCTITVAVGPNAKEYPYSRKNLCQSSEYFAGLFQHSFREQVEAKVVIEDCSLEDWDMVALFFCSDGQSDAADETGYLQTKA